jgi:16S rRNA (cytidine1402-2'-O)-methyltransferase
VASALPADHWRFEGFLPRKRSELERVFKAPETLVAFESPRRLAATLAQLATRDPGRPLSVCRELTKLHEEVRRGTAAELAGYYAEHPPRGEVVLVLGPAHPAGTASGDVVDPRHIDAADALRELVDAGARARPAAKVVAKLTGTSANELYRQLTEEPRREDGGAS